MPIHIPFPHLPGYSLSSIYTGNGSDGTVIINSPITFSRDMHYHNVIILGAGSVDTNGWMFFADGYCDLTNAGANAIHANGYPGGGMSPGAGRTGHTVGGSSGGGAGARNATPYAPYYDGSLIAFNGSNGYDISYSNGGVGVGGGAGGQSSSYVGSGNTSGGTASNAHLSTYNTYNRYMYYSNPTLTQGGAGSGGGGSGAGVALSESYLLGGYGGGGGGGGGVVGVFVNQLRIGSSTAASSISSIGGNGAVGGAPTGAWEGPTYYYSGPGGTGGQGGGGFVYICYNTKSGSKSNIIDVTGGQNGGCVVYNGQTRSIITSGLHGSATFSL